VLPTQANQTIEIDNVSVKEVGQNWTVANDDANNYVEFNQDEGTVRLKFLNTSPLTTLTSDTQYLSGKKYKLTVDVKEVVSGGVKIDAAGVSQTYNSVGIQEAIIEPTGNSNISFYRASADVDITLNSVSLIEITDDTDLPRIDYTSGFGSLLLEPQRTNVVTQSVNFSSWSAYRATLTDNATTSPDGASNAAVLTEDTTNNSHPINNSFSTSSGVSYTFSIFVKKGSRRYLQILALNGGSSIYYDLETKSAGSGGGVEDYGSGWLRLTYTYTTNSTNAEFYIQPSINGTSVIYTGDGSNAVYLYGAQLEAGSYATSYIPTNGSTVTRSADVANNSGNADLFNDSEGVLYAEIAALADDGTFRQLTISDNSTSDRISIDFTSTSNQIRSFCSSGGSTVANMTGTVTDVKQFNKVAVKYKLNDYALWINGVEVATDTSASAPTGLKELAFDNSAGSNNFKGNVKCVAVFKEALTDAELQQLTS
jgi:hypothetical protein